MAQRRGLEEPGGAAARRYRLLPGALGRVTLVIGSVIAVLLAAQLGYRWNAARFRAEEASEAVRKLVARPSSQTPVAMV
jgi:hypothetical protein